MDNINLLAKDEKELETLIQAARIYSDDIMEFGIEKCAMLIMKSGKRQITEGTELPKQEKKNQNAWGEGNLQILGKIGSGHNQTSGDEGKSKNNISRERENYSKSNYIAEISSK